WQHNPRVPQINYCHISIRDWHFLSSLDIKIVHGHIFYHPCLGDIFLGNPALNPETGNFFDIGCRYWKNDLTVKANVFYNTFTDLVVDKAVIKDSLYQKANIGKAALYGFDASVEYVAISRLSVYTTASYVRGEDTKNSANLPQVPPFNG
ncbi:MAG: TonB-dependent receptor, partial [Ignavibacteriales bacterium]|nr:TonB-dependent receptor [Ignavibacteriales bacterium]